MRKKKLVFSLEFLQRTLTSTLSFTFYFFIMRGTAVEKAFKKMQKQWIDPLSFIFKAYKTDNPTKRSDLKRDDPLSRLAACFPQTVCYFLSRGIGKTYIDKEIIEIIAGYEIPRQMLTNVFIALVQKTPQYSVLVDYCKVYHFMPDLKLSGKTNKGLDTIIKI